MELELELIQSHMAQKPMLRGEVGARALRVRSVSREEVWASAGVQGAWVSGCGCEADWRGVEGAASGWKVTDIRAGQGGEPTKLLAGVTTPRHEEGELAGLSFKQGDMRADHIQAACGCNHSAARGRRAHRTKLERTGGIGRQQARPSCLRV
jgi:hypothetical protein